MAVARQTPGLGNPLIHLLTLEDRAGVQLSDDLALHLLPRRLMRRIGVAAGSVERGTPDGEVFRGHEQVDVLRAEVDADRVARPQQRERTAGGGFGRRVEDRRRPARPRLPTVTEARQGVDTLFDQIGGGRMLTTSAEPG